MWPWGSPFIADSKERSKNISIALGKKNCFICREEEKSPLVCYLKTGDSQVEATGFWIMKVAQERSLGHGPHAASARTAAGLG